MIATQLVAACPRMPSMSSPMCVCASKISASGGRSRAKLVVPDARQLERAIDRVPHSCLSLFAHTAAGVVALRLMPDVLIYGDTLRSPELRHEVAVPIPDPFLYAERNGRRVVAIHSLEVPRVRGIGLDVLSWDELGWEELLDQGVVARRALPPRRRARMPLARARERGRPAGVPRRARRPSARRRVST